MTVTFSPARLHGEVTAPPSKSMAHRLLICAGLADGVSIIRNVGFSDDISATLECLHALGVRTGLSGDTVTVYGRGIGNLSPKKPLPCHESGSTLRFFLPICLFLGGTSVLTGTETLLSRPLGVYEAVCAENGIAFLRDKTSVRIEGKLNVREFAVAGDISSQFVTGLLLALGASGTSVSGTLGAAKSGSDGAAKSGTAAAGDGGSVSLTGRIESRPYIDMTLAVMRQFGVNAVWTDERTLSLPPNPCYRAVETTVEGDYSSAAFLEAFNCLGGDVRVRGLNPDSLQGDRVYTTLFGQLLHTAPTISLADCPDLAPILMAVAADCHGAVFTDTSRLKLKESDRGRAMADELHKFGADVRVFDNVITVARTSLHRPTEDCCSHHDHRVAMALSVLMTKYGGTLHDAQTVDKSFPGFFDCLTALGAVLQFHSEDHR